MCNLLSSSQSACHDLQTQDVLGSERVPKICAERVAGLFMRRSLIGLFSLIVLIAGVWFSIQPDISDARGKGKHWTKTRPPINFAHIFYGEINRSGRPVGFHARPDGKDPRFARVVRQIERPNQKGVYVARVAIRDPRSNQWLEKNSSIFPDKMSREEVIKAVLHAFRKGKTDDRGKFRGPSGLGFMIEGWTLRDGKINTAYPIYRSERRRRR